MTIDLFYFGPLKSPWAQGQATALPENLRAAAAVVQDCLKKSKAESVLFWDMRLGEPAETGVLNALLSGPGDVWHAGLKLGMAGLPASLDFVEPIWMFSRDPGAEQEATSWRLSLKACLVRTDVLRQFGLWDPVYKTWEAAALSWGNCLLRRGAFVRSAPQLLSGKPSDSRVTLPVYDEFRFIRYHYGKKWLNWAAFRAVWNGYPLSQVLASHRQLQKEEVPLLPPPYRHRWPEKNPDPSKLHGRISILIPTLQRYSYLRNELKQLQNQSVRPLDIMVVDQTPAAERETGLEKEFPDLPLKVIHQDVQGQCTAWNAAIENSKGEFLLFLGDDADQIATDFLEKFLKTFEKTGADMVASAVEEKGGEQISEGNSFLRISDTFPICMIRREAFAKSGLLDYAFDRGSRADADLAMRCYLTGAFMVFDPGIRILHLRAPRGGLRAHKARVMTYGTSRNSFWHRDIPSATEIYLVKRHYSARQYRELIWQRCFGTLAMRGNALKRSVKFLLGLLRMPGTLAQICQTSKRASSLLADFPKIPELKQ
jgi:GT2 family glycosyltransferase